MDKLATDMSDSAASFLSLVWPVVRDMIGGGEVVPVENVTDSSFATQLDQLAGIDAWHICGNSDGMRGIASRVQKMPLGQERDSIDLWLNVNWFKTFTIRYKRMKGSETEWSKRLRACRSDRGLLMPHLTVQAYRTNEPINSSKLLGVAVVRTAELIEFMATHEEAAVAYQNIKDGELVYAGRCPPQPPCYMQRVGGIGNWFFVAPWRVLSGNIDIKMRDMQQEVREQQKIARLNELQYVNFLNE